MHEKDLFAGFARPTAAEMREWNQLPLFDGDGNAIDELTAELLECVFGCESTSMSLEDLSSHLMVDPYQTRTMCQRLGVLGLIEEFPKNTQHYRPAQQTWNTSLFNAVVAQLRTSLTP